MIIKTLVNKNIVAGIAIMVAALLSTQTTNAQTTVPPAEVDLGFDLSVSSDYSLTVDPTDPQNIRHSQWRTNEVMQAYRAAPVIRITNNAEVPIERFFITIPVNVNRNYLWDTYQILEAATSTGVTISTPGDNLLGGSQSNILEVVFTDGLAPDDSFAIRADLINQMNGSMSDYRSALWDSTNFSNPDSSDNAYVTVDFDAPDLLGGDDMLMVPFFDYFNQNKFDYSDGDISGQGFVHLGGGHHMQDSMVVNLNTITTVVVPEPSTIMMTIFGMLGIVGFFRRRQQRK